MTVITKTQNAESWMTVQEKTFAKLSQKFDTLSLELDNQSVLITSAMKTIKNTTFKTPAENESAVVQLKDKIENFRGTVFKMKNLLDATNQRITSISNRLVNDKDGREFLGQRFDDILDDFEDLQEAATAEVTTFQYLPDDFSWNSDKLF